MMSTLIETVVETLTGRTRVTVDETYRAIQVDRGEVVGILTPGTYRLPSRKDRLVLEWYEVSDLIFLSEYEQALFEKRPEVAAEQLIVFTTGESEMAVIERDGRIFTVLKPDTKMVVWADMGPWETTLIDIADDPAVEAKLAKRLKRSTVTDAMLTVTVDEGKTALITIDGKLDRQLGPGVYGFWKSGRQIETKLVDLRHQTLDVVGQELLTKDRVTIRVNIAANYRVTDPTLAVSAVKDFADVLYRTLQTVFRKALGAKTLDQILENKATVDGEALKLVQTDLAAIGVEVSDLT
ncbi:MAG: SPFH domain-containing protein, partial [Pseudomonadota bacterium]